MGLAMKPLCLRVGGRAAIVVQKTFRASRIGPFRNVKVRRMVAEFMRNKDRDVADAKARTKRNYFRIQAILQRDVCEDMDDDYGVAHDWYQYWDEGQQRWMWYSGEYPPPPPLLLPCHPFPLPVGQPR